MQERIGIRLEVGGGRKVDIWTVYVGDGKHEGFKWPEGDRNVVVLGDFNAKSKRWGGEEERNSKEGRLVEDWIDEWGLKVGNKVGEVTRIDEREGFKSRVLDLAIYGGGLEMKVGLGDGIVGLDHRALLVEVEVLGWEIDRELEKRKSVDWLRFEGELELWWEEGLMDWNGKGGRRELDEVVTGLEEGLKERLKRCEGRRKWKGGRKKWWDEEVERMRLRVREKEKGRRALEGGEGREEVRELRKEYKGLIERKKGEYWLRYLEGVSLLDGFRFVKTDRDFLTDLPNIRGEDGTLVTEDGSKGREIVLGLGKREALEQELEGFEKEGGMELDEEMVEEALWKQKDGKAEGVNGLGGKVFKLVWKREWGRNLIKGIYRRSLELGYVPERFRESVGVVMRKPNKPDYSLPNSYRVINLLDVLGKGLERVVVKLLGCWSEEGLGREQWGAREGRSSMEAVGKLMGKWERSGGLGLLLCMDVKGGYENVGVTKMEERLRGLGVEVYLRKWISSFLRERRVKVRVGKRMGDWTNMKGGTVQGSPLSPILFMLLLGGVLEEVRKEGVEGLEVAAVVDDVDFMVVGRDEEEVLERAGRMEEGLKRGLKKWEVDVQLLKLEGLWMDRGEKRRREVNWMGERIELKEEVRVLGVWWQGDGSWESHVRRRIGIGETRWKMMLRLLGRNGRGVSVEVLNGILKMVVMKAMMYGMELYWDGNWDMRRKLEVWRNRLLRRVLGAVRTTPIDSMLGELGWKSLELEMDRKVSGWGGRLKRRGFWERGEEGWEEEEERVGSWRGGWEGRVLRGMNKYRLEGERLEVEAERGRVIGWRVEIGEGKEEAKVMWEKGREERDKNWLVGLGDASEKGGRMGIGGGLWEYGRRRTNWKCNLGWGLTVGEGEMEGLGRVLERALEYDGVLRRLMVGVDNKGVLLRLRKGRGFCGEMEQRVRERGLELLRRGWEVVLIWVPGHVGVRENEEVDKWAKEGVWEEEDERVGGILTWGKWEERRKKEERRCWKEYWVFKRKGREYFGSGGSGELGHDGNRWESLFLFWMRVGHGKMRGSRYGMEGNLCECGKREDRDHVLLYCEKWEEERKRMLEGWREVGGIDGGWVDMEGLLFGREGLKLVKEFGRETGWMKTRWDEKLSWDKGRKEGRGYKLRNERDRGRVWGSWEEERRKRKREVDNKGKKRKREELKRKKKEEEENFLRSGERPIASGSTDGVKRKGKRKALEELENNRNVRGLWNLRC